MIIRYFVASLSSQFCQTLSLVTLSLVLSADDLGIFRSLLAFVLALGPLLSLGLDQHLLKKRFAFSTARSLSVLLGTTVFVVVGIACLSSLLYVHSFFGDVYASTFQFLLAFSLALTSSIYGISSVIASWFQREGNHSKYNATYSLERILPSISVVLLILNFKNFFPFFAFAIGYCVFSFYIFISFRRTFIIRSLLSAKVSFKPSYLRALISILKGAIFLVLLSVLPSNLEFFLFPLTGISFNEIGIYVKSSLFFAGSVSVVSPLIKHRVTLLSCNRNFSDVLTRYQGQFVVLSALLSLCICLASYGLYLFNSYQYNHQFLGLSFLFALKLIAWSTVCLSGAVLYIMERTRLSIYLALLQLTLPLVCFLLTKSSYAYVFSQSVAYLLSYYFINRSFRQSSDIRST